MIVIEVCWDGDNGVVDLLAQITLSDFFHLSKNHGGDLLRGERPVLAVDFNGNGRLLIAVGDFEWEMLDIGLNIFVRPLTANESPVENHELYILDQKVIRSLDVVDCSLGV